MTFGELLAAGVVLLIAFLLSRWIRRTLRSFLESRDNVAPQLPELIGRGAGWLVMLTGAITALMIIGIQMGPVVILLALFAALCAVSAHKVMENFAAGLSLQVTSPFMIGDRIETAGVTGWVEAITARAVVLTSPDRRTVYIPNSTVLDSVLFNYTDDDTRRSEIAFAIPYGHDVPRVRAFTVAAIVALDVVHDEPVPVVYIDGISDGCVSFQMRFHHADSDRVQARDQVAETILSVLDANGVSMPTPTVHIEPTIGQVRRDDLSRRVQPEPPSPE